MCNSETSLAKGLFQILVENGSIDDEFRGLWGNIWVSSRKRAYRLTDLTLDHFDNIVRKYHENNEPLPDIFIEARKIIVERNGE